MTDHLSISKSLTGQETNLFDFSICTLVTRKEEYNEMLASYIDKGFTTDCCEYLHIDNSEKCMFDAYQGLNFFLQKAQGKYIILCHQDILIHDNNKDDLQKIICEIEVKDPNWAVLANAGGVNLKWIATHITQKSGKVIKEQHLPLKVITIDENFIVVKKIANLALSNDLSGFHMYGTDLCLIADILGFNSYVIGFNLIHKSNGNVDKSFYDSKQNLIQKYRKAFRNRYISTTITRFGLKNKLWTSYLCNTGLVLFLVRQFYKFSTRKQDYVLK